MRRASFWNCIVVVALFAVGCDPPPPPRTMPSVSPSTPQDDIDFSSWPKMTTAPYPVAPVIYLMCRAPQIDPREAEHGPHVIPYIVVRVNPEAEQAFRDWHPLPEGSVVVKEKHTLADGSDAATHYTSMRKREAGYDPDHGDWEYVDVRLTPEKAVTRGVIANCVGCHTKQKGTDYLFRTYMSDR